MADDARHTFIQWKGTDVCMDVYCPGCGMHGHVDADFVYAIKCCRCQAIFQVGDEVKLTPMTERPEGYMGGWFDNPTVMHDDDGETGCGHAHGADAVLERKDARIAVLERELLAARNQLAHFANITTAPELGVTDGAIAALVRARLPEARAVLAAVDEALVP